MKGSFYIFSTFIVLTVAAAFIADQVQRDFGNLAVSNVLYENASKSRIRAKLFRPDAATAKRPQPGIVYVHGYQNNRETSDPFCIEAARRGIVALCIDALGRGNSSFPAPVGSPDFDKTFGTKASVAYLRGLDFVDATRIGVMGNSLGGELAFEEAILDPTIRATVFSGFAFDKRAERSTPHNMLMLFGANDEYRERMLGTPTEAAWLRSSLVKHVTGALHPESSVTYGRLDLGDARRIEFPEGSHLVVSHSKAAVASAVDWILHALQPAPGSRLAADDQIWPFKEWACLFALIFGLAALLPLLDLLLRLPWFRPLTERRPPSYNATRHEMKKRVLVNTLLTWLYLPLVMTLYAIHIYVFHIDKAFPMMITNGIVFWFLVTNVIGFGLFLRWKRRSPYAAKDLGLRFDAGRNDPARTAALAAVLIVFAIGFETLLERAFIVDYRFVFPFASDLTPERTGLMLRYLPFLCVAFFGTDVLLHVQLPRAEGPELMRAFLYDSALGSAVLIAPLLVLIAVQYVPVYLLDTAPLTGPGGAFVSFIMNLIHVVMVLLLCVPISTFCFLKTKTPYLGALVNGALVAWMFASSQVVAPLPL